MPIKPGTNIGQYTVLDSLGAGGMGEVYLARDTRLGRKIALKFLSAEYTKDEDRVRRFQQEARAASALNHPNLITIFEIGEVDSVHFISTEFIEGETLRRRLATRKLSNAEIFEVAIQVGSALATAHAAGITHRDIKPENIMVRPDGVVKVLDFGLAKLTEASTTGETAIDPTAVTKRVVATNPGVVMGTVSYMSPEQARGTPVDARTDIFSFGVVLYEMTAGRVPFEGSSFGDIITGIISKKHLPLARYSPEVPQELERIVGKALAKDREERYQSIKDLLIDLKRLKQRLEVEAEIEHTAPPDWAREAVMAQRSGSGVQGSGSGQTIAMGASGQAVHTTSSAEYLVSEIKRHKKGTFLVLAAAVLAAVAITFVSTRRPINSVAILPFSNQTGDAKMDSISDEITEGIINHLFDLPHLRVTSYGSVEQYKGRQIDPQAVGNELGVRAVMIGRISKRDDVITVNAELVDAGDKSRIWGVQEKLKFSELTLAHHRIARSVLEKLGLKLSEEQLKELDAQDLYATGKNYLNQRTPDGLNKGIEYFDKAVALKPDYALAHVGLADCYNMLATYGARSPIEAFPLAKAEARKALDVDDSLAEAHTSLAYALFRGDWKWTEAEREFRQALRLNPKLAQACQWYANLLVALGRSDEAIAQSKRAHELDSTSSIIRSNIALVHFYSRRYDEAIAVCQKFLELDPTYFAARRYLGQAYAQKGKYDLAISEFQKAVAANGSPLIRAELAHTYALAGKKDEAQKILEDLQRMSSDRYISPYHIALVYSGLGNKEEAFNRLEQAFRDRADSLVYLKIDPRFDLLHGDHRFASLIERIGLP
ncbi:MAG TPA: protein kinase [Blastocatellia bacterium]|nr:protein kinase [Blastocatellia bacterium]